MTDVTRPIRTLIVDDEPLARRGLRQLLAGHRDVVVAAEARNGREALEALASTALDLVFLDVQMPELDGLGVVRSFGPARMPLVVFVTAFDSHAVRAFEAHALDYLVKPVTDERFDGTMQRVRRQLAVVALEAAGRSLASLVAELAATTAASRTALPVTTIVVPTSTGDTVVDCSEIDWIGAEDYYAAIYFGRQQLLLRESMTSLEARLDPSSFLRVHRSAIVNLARVRQLQTSAGNAMHVVLRDGTQLPVSRRRRAQLVQRVRLRAP